MSKNQTFWDIFNNQAQISVAKKLQETKTGQTMAMFSLLNQPKSSGFLGIFGGGGSSSPFSGDMLPLMMLSGGNIFGGFAEETKKDDDDKIAKKFIEFLGELTSSPEGRQLLRDSIQQQQQPQPQPQPQPQYQVQPAPQAPARFVPVEVNGVTVILDTLTGQTRPVSAPPAQNP